MTITLIIYDFIVGVRHWNPYIFTHNMSQRIVQRQSESIELLGSGTGSDVQVGTRLHIQLIFVALILSTSWRGQLIQHISGGGSTSSEADTQPLGIIQGDLLLLRPGDGIVVLHDSQRFAHKVQMRSEFRGFLGSQGTQLLADLQKVVAITLESLQGGARCEVTRPVGMRIGGIWKEVIALLGPSNARVVQRFQIARWRGVE